MTTSDIPGSGWAADSCTLPTAEQPLREAEFDDLFATSVRAVDRVSPTTLRLTVEPIAEPRARELAERETSCCSFFEFGFGPDGAGAVWMTVTVPEARVAVLDGFTARAVGLAR